MTVWPLTCIEGRGAVVILCFITVSPGRHECLNRLDTAEPTVEEETYYRCDRRQCSY